MCYLVRVRFGVFLFVSFFLFGENQVGHFSLHPIFMRSQANYVLTLVLYLTDDNVDPVTVRKIIGLVGVVAICTYGLFLIFPILFIEINRLQSSRTMHWFQFLHFFELFSSEKCYILGLQVRNQRREEHLFNWQEFIVSGLACKRILCFKGLIEPLPPHTEVTRRSDKIVWFNCNGSVF